MTESESKKREQMRQCCFKEDDGQATTQKLDGFFANSTYSFAWLLKKLGNNDEAFQKRLKKSQVIKIEYRNIGIGNGYASKMLKAEIHFADAEKPHCAVLKIPDPRSMEKVKESFDVDIQSPFNDEMGDIMNRAHEDECRFYRLFAKTPSLPIPRVFIEETTVPGERDGIILMEYLGDTGKCQDRIKPFNKRQVMSLVRGLSKLMAASLSIDPGEFQLFEMSPKLLVNRMACIQSAIPVVTKKKPGYFTQSIARLEHYLQDSSFMRLMVTKLNKELGLKPVISHSDLWVNNIFWKQNAAGECSDELLAIFDWQTAHCGTVARDLSHVLVISTDAELRKEIEMEMCEYLYECLKSDLRTQSLGMPYTLEQIKKCYRMELVLHAMYSIMYAYVFTESQTNEESAEVTELKENVWRRLKVALDDAATVIETEMPQWLRVSCSSKSKTVS